MTEYKLYRRTQVAEMADWEPGFDMAGVSVSKPDAENGSPKLGDKIARNPANHDDRWLVAKAYFEANFEPLSGEEAGKITIEIGNLTEAQALAIADLLATWQQLASWGSSRWTAFYADGDGNFHPQILIDGKKPEHMPLIPRDKCWPYGYDGDYRIDYDWIAWKLREAKEKAAR